jgi:hypothetical protein
MDLSQILIAAGAPLLKEIIQSKLGGVGGQIAGGVIDTLAERLGVPATPEAIGAKIEADPNAPVVVRQVEAEVRQDLFLKLFSWLPPDAVQFYMGLGMLIAGLARVAGLIVNGARKHVTPRIRQVSAGVGCMIWFGITYGFASSDVVSTWRAIYPLFGICELVNIHRAAHDEGETRNGRTG